MPASAIAGPSDDERAGEDEAVTVVAAGVSGEAVVAGAELRGRAAGGTAALLRACADVGCDEVSRAKSFPMFRATSQPDKSNSPIPTVCLITPLIVIIFAQCL